MEFNVGICPHTYNHKKVMWFKREKLKDEKIILGTTTKKTPSTIMAAATTIAPLLASAAMILGIQKQTSQQTIERKEIQNFLYL